jgi:hypothetical protein
MIDSGELDFVLSDGTKPRDATGVHAAASVSGCWL